MGCDGCAQAQLYYSEQHKFYIGLFFLIPTFRRLDFNFKNVINLLLLFSSVYSLHKTVSFVTD
jgi:hypothetical protein